MMKNYFPQEKIWQEKKLIDLFELQYGKEYKDVLDKDGSIPVLGTGGIIAYSNKPLFSSPSVLIGRKGTIDKPIYIDKPFRTVDTLFYTKIFTDVVLPKFLYYLAQTINWKRYSEQTGVPSLSSKSIYSIKVKIPDLSEQQKIADFFSLLDERIGKQEDKVRLLEDQKRGLTQKIFSRELRFKADDGNEYPEWEETTLESFSLNGFLKDGDWVESKDQDSTGDIRLLQLADIGENKFRNKSNRRMNSAAAKRLNYTPLEENDILIARMPDPIGRACLVPKEETKSATVVDVAILRVNHETVPEFISQQINSPVMRAKIERLKGGGTRQRVTRSALGGIYLFKPSFGEQQKIADLLHLLDEQINKSNLKLALLKAEKGAYLNKIFE